MPSSSSLLHIHGAGCSRRGGREEKEGERDAFLAKDTRTFLVKGVQLSSLANDEHTLPLQRRPASQP